MIRDNHLLVERFRHRTVAPVKLDACTRRDRAELRGEQPQRSESGVVLLAVLHGTDLSKAGHVLLQAQAWTCGDAHRRRVSGCYRNKVDTLPVEVVRRGVRTKEGGLLSIRRRSSDFAVVGL